MHPKLIELERELKLFAEITEAASKLVKNLGILETDDYEWNARPGLHLEFNVLRQNPIVFASSLCDVEHALGRLHQAQAVLAEAKAAYAYLDSKGLRLERGLDDEANQTLVFKTSRPDVNIELQLRIEGEGCDVFVFLKTRDESMFIVINPDSCDLDGELIPGSPLSNLHENLVQGRPIYGLPKDIWHKTLDGMIEALTRPSNTPT